MGKRLTQNEFLTRAKKVHGDRYDYSLTVYRGVQYKIEIICKTHGKFLQIAHDHVNSAGCMQCAYELIAQHNRNRFKQRIEDFSHIDIPKGSKIINMRDGKYILIDEEDYEKVKDNNWYINKYINKYINTYYAKACVRTANGKQGNLKLHRVIMGLEDSDKRVVDHINGNGLDNRKSNLRICTVGENNRNTKIRDNRGTSKYKGVYKDKASNKWKSLICFDRKKYNLGSFTNEQDAARAYDKKALELHGEFASINFK